MNRELSKIPRCPPQAQLSHLSSPSSTQHRLSLPTLRTVAAVTKVAGACFGLFIAPLPTAMGCILGTLFTHQFTSDPTSRVQLAYSVGVTVTLAASTLAFPGFIGTVGAFGLGAFAVVSLIEELAR